MELLKSHVPFIREMISNVKTVDYRQKWENMLNMIECNVNLSEAQIEIMNQNVAKAKQFKQQYESKSPQSMVKQTNDSQKTNDSAEKKTVRYPEKRRLNELKRLHENIVKTESIPTKRERKRASFGDFLEDKDLVVRRRKSDYVLVRRNESPEAEKPKKTKNDPETEEERKISPSNANKRASLPIKLSENDNKIKKIKLDGKVVSVVMESSQNGDKSESKMQGRRIQLDGKPARIVNENTEEIGITPKGRGRKPRVSINYAQTEIKTTTEHEISTPLVKIPKEVKIEPMEKAKSLVVIKNPSAIVKKVTPIQKIESKARIQIAGNSTPQSTKSGNDMKKFPPKIAPLRISDLKMNSLKEKETADKQLSSLQMFCKKIQKQHEKKSKKSFRNALLKKRIIPSESKTFVDDEDDEWEDLDDEKPSQESTEDEEINDKIFSKVENIAYTAVNDNFIFKCLVANCDFGTDKNELFLDHLEDNHMDIKWSGFCNICSQMASNKQRSIVFELMHMRENHVLKEKQKNAKKDDAKIEVIFPKTAIAVNNEKKTTQKIIKSPSVEKIIAIPSDNSGIKKHIIMKPAPTPSTETSSPSETEASNESVQEKPTMGTIDLLRPWCKRKIKKFVVPATQMLTPKVLAAKYKCMGKLCSFFTSNEKLFESHLKFHQSFAPADKDFMNCAYCDCYFSVKIIDLINHINTFHCYDKYACSYCFYRSCANFNVLAHQKMYHNTKTKLIYELNLDKVRDYGKEFEAIIEMRSKVVLGIPCFHCKDFFYTFQDLRTHLPSHGERTQVKCIKCNVICTNEHIPHHLTKCLMLGLYQCVYCIFGTNTFTKICDHVADLHSSKIPVFCERMKQDNHNEDIATIESLCIKHITQMVDVRIIHKSKFKDEDLKNEENVMHLGGNVKIQQVSNLFKKVKVSATKEPEKKKNIEENGSSTLQIQNVFSLSDLNSV
ncbi:hypothetical protein PVAND_002954 [Polypedilum vanderplanki]|uniref:C2H2-type domain-containing protein n=1 Tax=Polypedilum vanderplanki TaxID=319348 RepID=A0A9J6BSK3_POLVA|nr:hypothetical protein PVAND_002954 [Polypedilum vanderplanki]